MRSTPTSVSLVHTLSPSDSPFRRSHTHPSGRPALSVLPALRDRFTCILQIFVGRWPVILLTNLEIFVGGRYHFVYPLQICIFLNCLFLLRAPHTPWAGWLFLRHHADTETPPTNMIAPLTADRPPSRWQGANFFFFLRFYASACNMSCTCVPPDYFTALVWQPVT